jgi:hypothetical protein
LLESAAKIKKNIFIRVDDERLRGGGIKNIKRVPAASEFL